MLRTFSRQLHRALVGALAGSRAIQPRYFPSFRYPIGKRHVLADSGNVATVSQLGVRFAAFYVEQRFPKPLPPILSCILQCRFVPKNMALLTGC
jgi:hypothetical protein